MSIEPQVMRAYLLEAFRRKPKTQYEDLKYEVAQVAAERDQAGLSTHSASGPMLARGDWRSLREAVWALIADGVCVPGMNDSNEFWPWLSLTEYGEVVASSQGPVPHDPYGYLSTLDQQQALDPTERDYLTQALEAHNRGLVDASAVMLGAVSEHLVELLVEAIGKADPKEAAAAQLALGQSALAAHRYAFSYFTSHQNALSRPLRESLNTSFGSIATLIRIARNDAGHPALPTVVREESLANLQLFPRLRQWVLAAQKELPL